MGIINEEADAHRSVPDFDKAAAESVTDADLREAVLRKFSSGRLAAELQRRGVLDGPTVEITTATMYEDVGLFHKKMQLDNYDKGGPRQLTNDEFRFRYNFLQEELRELVESRAVGDLSGQLDALCDLVWVALGTAQLMRMPFDQAWNEVRRANMEKRPWVEGDPIKARNTKGLEVVKPEGWQPPQVATVIMDRRQALYNKGKQR